MLIRPPNFPSTLSMKTTIAVSVLLLPALSLNAQLTRKDWLQADEQTVRLKPSAFPSLPSAVRTELEYRGCTIPQPSGASQPRNVVSGSFISAGRPIGLCCVHAINVLQSSY